MSRSEIVRVRASRAALALALPTAGVTVSPVVAAEDLAEAARCQGIAVEAYEGAVTLGLEDVAEALRPTSTAILINGMRLLAVTSQLVQLLGDAGIPCAVMKGVGLAQLTRSNPLGRPAGDVDILIPPGAVVAAHSMLHANGGRLGYAFVAPDDSLAYSALLKLRHEATYMVAGQKLDLHWHLGSVRNVLPSTEDTLERCVTVDIQGFTIPTLGLQDALVHSAVHWRTFGFRKLKYVLDLEALRSQMPFEEVASLPLFVKKVLLVSRAMRTSTDDARPTGWVPRAMWWQASNALSYRPSPAPIDTRTRIASFVEQVYETPGPDRLLVPLRAGVGPVLRLRSRIGAGEDGRRPAHP